MAGQIAAQDGAILKGADTVANTRAELNQQITTLRGQMDSIGGGWQGNASVAFGRLMVRWDEEARKTTGALEGFEENLRGAQRDYDTSDTDQSDTFSHFASRLS